MRRSDIPFGAEFSPDQVDLRALLEIAQTHGGDWRRFEAAVHDLYYCDHDCNEYNRRKLANNTKLAMIAYGLIDRDANLTDLGRELHGQCDDEDALTKRFVRHILLELEGLTVVECIRSIQMAGERPTLELVANRLADYDLYAPDTGRHLPTLLIWLRAADVFKGGPYNINEARLKELVGMDMEDIEALSVLTTEQRAFLRALANLGNADAPYLSNEVEALASATYGVTFSRKQTSTQVVHPLVQAGLITAERGTAGRGAKPFLVQPTEKFVVDVMEPLLRRIETQVGARLRPLLRRPMKDIVAELDANDRHVRGLALEALAFKLMRLIDLSYVGTRLRGEDTGGAEVDLVFESARLVFSRWQIQCKNKAAISLDDVAKEVGLVHLLKSNVIVIVSTGRIGPASRQYANTVMAGTNLSIALLDGNDIEEIVDRPTAIVEVLNREAEHAMDLKSIDV
jgi:site-specific DNA-methyltransferase (cytosine-N4-specific)